MRRNLATLSALVLIAACTKVASPFAGESSTEKDEIVDKEDDRPTESGEGVPGYFAAPDRITVQLEGGKATVTGSPGAASARARIEIYKLELAKLREAIGASQAALAAVHAISIVSARDGSFKAIFAVTADEVVFLSTAARTSGDELAIPAASGADRRQLVFDVPAAPRGFGPLRSDTELPSGSLLTQCALGPIKEGAPRLFAAPSAMMGNQYCYCKTSKGGVADHPLRQLFNEAPWACEQQTVPAAKQQQLRAYFVEYEPGVCGPVSWNCAAGPDLSLVVREDLHQAPTLIDAWKLALTRCKAFKTGASGTPFKIADVTDEQCKRLRLSFTERGKTVTACELDPDGFSPAVVAKCLGDSLSTRSPCDYVFFFENYCLRSADGKAAPYIFRDLEPSSTLPVTHQPP